MKKKKIEIVMSRSGWQMTKNVGLNFHRLHNKEGYLSDAFIAIHSSIRDFVNNNEIEWDKNYIIVETNYPMLDKEVCLCAIIEVSDMILNQYIKVFVELHMMMQEEHAGVNIT